MNGKKDGKQRYRVRINYQDYNGKNRQIDRVTYGFDEAKNLEMKLQYDLKNETQNHSLTLNQLFDEYISAKEHENRESTIKKTIRIFNNHILESLGNIKIKKLNTPILQQWKISIENKKSSTKENLALKTKKNIFSELRTVLNYAVKMEYLQSNPLTRVGNFKNTSIIQKEMDFYTSDEFKKFIAIAKQCAINAEKENNIYEWNFYIFFSIAFYTGLRKGEIHALQWNDLDNDFNYLSVKRSLNQKVKSVDVETPPKNNSSYRTMQIPTPLKNILKEHFKRCKNIDGFQTKFKICGGITPLRDTTIQLRNKMYSDLANVKTIRIHDFRHSHASLLANRGINIQEIARRLGHSKIEITWNTYSHLYPKEEEKAMQVLNEVV